jgi:phosphoglycerol transferase MdoB-like AlkP superfamily enzyme
MASLLLAFLLCANAWYAVVYLPRYFGALGVPTTYAFAACVMAAVAALLMWRREGLIHGFVTGLAVFGGLIGLFWPASETLLQHIDGGGMSTYQNVVFLGAALSSLVALIGVGMELLRGQASTVWLLAATIGTAAAGLVAPGSPPGARWELTLGLPFLVSGLIARRLARERHRAA